MGRHHTAYKKRKSVLGNALFTIATEDTCHVIDELCKPSGNTLIIGRNREHVILIAHGSKDGSFTGTREQIDAADVILCCYPACVAERYPNIGAKIPKVLRGLRVPLWTTTEAGRVWVTEKHPDAE